MHLQFKCVGESSGSLLKMQVPLAKIVSLGPVTTPLCESHLGMESNFLYRISELLYVYSIYVSHKLLVYGFP